MRQFRFLSSYTSSLHKMRKSHHNQNSISSRHHRVRTKLQKVQYDLERLEMNESTELAKQITKSIDSIDLGKC